MTNKAGFPLLQVGYVSTALRPQSLEALHNILMASRRNNSARDITGLLVAGGGRYLQILEGSPTALDDLLERIRSDGRHSGFVEFLRHGILERSFGLWSMAFRGTTELCVGGDYLRAVEAATEGMAEGRLKQQIVQFARLSAVQVNQAGRTGARLATDDLAA